MSGEFEQWLVVVAERRSSGWQVCMGRAGWAGVSSAAVTAWRMSTLNRHLKKQQERQVPAGSQCVEQSRLVAVELAAGVATVSAGECPGALTVLLSNGRRVEVGRGFDAATLAQLVTVLERL